MPSTLTISETAAELRVCRNTVYSLIRRKLLHVCRVGCRLRVRRVELERYLAQQQQIADRQLRIG